MALLGAPLFGAPVLAWALFSGALLALGGCSHRGSHDAPSQAAQVPAAAPVPAARPSDGNAVGSHAHGAHAMHGTAAADRTPVDDRRQPVDFPAATREHILANMRDHLFALQQIQQALSAEAFDRAADLAERRLGMSSLALHGAHEAARFMPPGMQDAGTAMHRSASRFAIAAHDAAARGDLRPALAALSELTATCVACHAAYRVK